MREFLEGAVISSNDIVKSSKKKTENWIGSQSVNNIFK